MSLSKYMRPRAVRHETRTLAGRFRGGKLAPAMAVAFRESESGVLRQSVVAELDPIPGRMVTPITFELTAVAVPIPAIDALKNPDDDYPGNSEVVRQKLLTGAPLFSLEEANEISDRLGVEPRSINGVKMVNEVARLAHNCAVNFLRQRKYVKASQVLASNTALTPAIIGQTVLDRLNGVLDPEDRVNGMVNLDLPELRLPVKGLGVGESIADAQLTETTDQSVREAGGETRSYAYSTDPTNQVNRFNIEGEQIEGSWYPAIYAYLAGGSTNGVSLLDFYRAQKMDGLTREMRKLVDDNPLYGEELVRRFASGMSVDIGRQPFILYSNTRTFGQSLQRAMDGASLDLTQTNTMVEMQFTVPVPATEFGMIVVTFLTVKPDETLAHQPHPILSEEWGAQNYVADEMALDPVPVTIRELNADCDQADENTVALYVGNNGLKRHYVNYGFNRSVDPTTVEAKTALWQIQVPMSVTPDSVIYPEDLNHYPFADQTAEVCTYTINSVARINTPMIFGPTPVEELAAIEDANIFEDVEILS